MSDLDRELPFAFTADLTFFEKSGGGKKSRRLAGVASTEEPDQQGEIMIQKGIDWSYFLSKGYFNDNHDKTIGGIIGYPEALQMYRQGDELPDGTIAKSHCTWVEGYLLQNDRRATEVWEKGLALRDTPRKLGLSVEGRARARSLDGSVVAKSLVRHCAVTHMPVNEGATANLFLKSLSQLEGASPDQLENAWEAFSKALTDQGLARRETRLSKARAIDVVMHRYPGISKEKARAVVEQIISRRRT